MAQFIATFIVLSMLGLIDTGYLIYKHNQHKPMVCPMNHDCSVVTESKWSRMFFVRNEVIGLLYYLSMFFGIFISIFLPKLIPNLFLLMAIASGIGLLFSIFLVYLQIKVIKDYCFYCMVSAIINLLLFANSIALFLGL